MSEFRPSLKICIDNTQEDEEESGGSASEAEEGELSGSNSSSSSSSSSSGSGSSSSSESEDEDAGGDRRTRRVRDRALVDAEERPKKVSASHRSRLSAEVMKQREERAKRFGIWHNSPKLSSDDLDKLYKTLGVSELDLKDNPRGIRLEAIHLRGVDEMSSENVLEYFQAYAPGSIEWIDDESCNIVWLDSMSAARAMIHLSKDQETVIEEYKKRKEKFRDKEIGNKEDKKSEPAPEPEDVEMEDDDVLDLLADDDIDAKPAEKVKEEPPKDEAKMETGEKESETGSIAESEEEMPDFPPGKWRMGPPTINTKGLFMRFAFSADKKQFGAEKNSKYYQKYGNPRYGGMTGLISNSRKRKMRHEQEEIESAKKAGRTQSLRSGMGDTSFDLHTRDFQQHSPLPQRAQPEVPTDDMFGDLSSLETFAVDVRKPKIKPKPKYTEPSDEEEEGQSCSPSGAEGGEEYEDDMDVEKELQELLAPPAPKRYMRMYADDVEDKLRDKKKSPEAATVFGHMDARARIENRRREKQMGGGGEPGGSYGNDLRSRLGNRRRRQQQREEEDEKPQTFEKLTVQLYND